MKKTKEAKFFCESCGSEVRKNDKTCPICGKFFASVKCPKCGRTGSTEEFTTGCPTCGYAVHPEFSGNGRKAGIFFKNKNSYYGNNGNRSSIDSYFFNNKTSKSKYNGDASLPIWIYVFVIIVLLLLVIMLYSCLIK